MSRLAFLTVAFLPPVLAQVITNAFCSSSSFDWARNSLGQSPCQVAAELAGVCNGGVFTLDALDPGFVYLGPTRASQNSCRCSTVYYSMISACAGCQGRNWIEWSEYNPNCTVVYPKIFPQALPTDVRVPAWAYADIEVTDGFNTSVAQSLASRPESTAGASPTAPIIPGTSVTAGFSSNTRGTTSRTPRPSTAANSDSENEGSSSGSNAGAIAGGVIGGVVGFALITGVIFFFVRRRRQATRGTASSAFNTTLYTPAPSGMSFNTATSPFPASQPQRFYDPSDPSTFPSTPAPVSSVYTTTSSPPPATFSSNTFEGSSVQVGQTGYIPPPMPPSAVAPTGRYTGAPEV